MKSRSLNHIYRLVWNAVTQTWLAVAESTRGRSKAGKTSKSGLALAAALLATGAAQADPSGGVITSGAGSIAQLANSTIINQQSQNLQLQWQSFNVGAGQSVTFNQPNARALAVNQIQDTHGSRILGNINANGQVWLINPNGVFFGKDAQVNVGGLLASTLNPLGLPGDGQQRFGKVAGSGLGSVVNEGTLTAAQGGYIALLGEQVRNQGVISAQLGTVALAGGSAVSLNFSGNQLLGVEVHESTLNNLSSNQQLIKADGGQVFMSAGARNSLLASAVNNSGTIEAQTIQEKDGRIILLSGMAAGTTTVGGTLDAGAPNGGHSGFVETSGATVKVADDAQVTTKAAQGQSGTWLLDPTDFTIEAGSGASTSSSIGASTLSASLANGNVRIQTDNANGTGNGDIHINAPVTWAADNTLTLSAYRDININADLTATGAAGKLALEYGLGAVKNNNPARYNIKLTEAGFGAKINLKAGNNFSTKLGSDGTATQFTVITELGAENVATNDGTLQGLAKATLRSALPIALGADIDASATSSWNAGLGFAPINHWGMFDGLGHTINALTINRPATDKVGLFSMSPGVIQNVGLVGGSVTGASYVGALVGWASDSVFNAYSSAAVTGKSAVGGLIGATISLEGQVRYLYATGNVTGVGGAGAEAVGGLIGFGGQLAGTSSPLVSSSYATGNVSATNTTGVGGLMGGSSMTFISDSYATGNVTVTGASSAKVGGLVGNLSGLASGSYSTGQVTSRDSSTDVGGLVGAYVGSVVARGMTVTGNFWDTQTSGMTTSALGTGKTTAEMKALGTFSGWNVIGIGGEYPKLVVGSNRTTPYWMTPGDQWQMGPLPTPVAYTLSDISSGYTYSGSAVSLGSLWDTTSIFGNTYSSWVLGTDYSFSYNGSAATSFTNAGTYAGIGVNVLKTGFATAPSGNTTGSLTIAKKAVTVSGITVADKAYDGSTTATVSTAGVVYTGLVSGEAMSTTATGTFASKNASATAQVVNLTATTAAGANTSLANYTVTEQTSASAKINKKAVTVSGITVADKAYDGTTAATANTTGAVYTGLVAGEAMSTTATGTFASKDASSTAQTVTLAATTTAGTNTSLANYTVTEQTSTTAKINKKAVTVSGITAADKDYDGTATATVNTAGAVYTGLVAGEALSTTATGTFASKDVYLAGVPQVVSLAATTTAGANTSLANYSVTEQASTSAAIRMKTVTVSGLTVADKDYDGRDYAVVNTAHAVYTGLVAGEAMSTSGDGVFASKDASPTAQVVTLWTTTSTGANTLWSNYRVTEQASTTAKINKKAVTVSGITAADKTYDGSTSATVNTDSATYDGLVTGELLTTTATGVFADKNASDAPKPVALTTSTTAGNADTLLSNYNVTVQTGTTASITRRALTITAAPRDKVYDGTTTASVDLLSSDKVAGDNLVYSVTGANYILGREGVTKNVGSNLRVFATGVNLGGADSGNYQTPTVSIPNRASITPRPVTVSGITAAEKPYDGTTAATVNTAGAVYTGLVAGEAMSTTATGTFASKDASATAQTVTLTATTTAGANTSLSNYTVTEQASTTTTINKKAVTVSGLSVANKTYDGSASATVDASTATYTGLIQGESLRTTATATFASKNANTTESQAVTIQATTVAGDANTLLSNYAVTEQTSASASIAKKVLTVSATASDKVYDSTSTAAVTLKANGVLTGETVTVSKTSADFVDSQGVANGNVGTGKGVSVTGISLGGADSSNYALGRISAVETTASITPATLTYVAAPVSFILGQPLNLSGSVTGLVGSDTLSNAVTGTATWTIDGNMNAPGVKGVIGGGLNATAGNYVFQQAQGNSTSLVIKPGSPSPQVQAVTAALQRGQGSLPTQLVTGHTTQAPTQPNIQPPVLSTDPGWGTLQVINQGLHTPPNLLINAGE
jgi:filamentous hemagglutinin family protein